MIYLNFYIAHDILCNSSGSEIPLINLRKSSLLDFKRTGIDNFVKLSAS